MAIGPQVSEIAIETMNPQKMVQTQTNWFADLGQKLTVKISNSDGLYQLICAQ